ncbi:hypothetical protein AWB84_00425 [Riemerella anatipestifer]|nr:hypothetical protein AWB84_00425 [Riemerella anatipestifer]
MCHFVSTNISQFVIYANFSFIFFCQKVSTVVSAVCFWACVLRSDPGGQRAGGSGEACGGDACRREVVERSGTDETPKVQGNTIDASRSGAYAN